VSQAALCRELHASLYALAYQLLKWRYGAAPRSRAWQKEIMAEGVRIRVLLEEAPALRPALDRYYKEAYSWARERTLKASDLRGFPPSDSAFTRYEVFAVIDGRLEMVHHFDPNVDAGR